MKHSGPFTGTRSRSRKQHDTPLADGEYVATFRFETTYPFKIDAAGQSTFELLSTLTQLRVGAMRSPTWDVTLKYIQHLCGLFIGVTPCEKPDAQPISPAPHRLSDDHDRKPCTVCIEQLTSHRMACNAHGKGTLDAPFCVHQEPVFLYSRWVTTDPAMEIVLRTIEFGQACLDDWIVTHSAWATAADINTSPSADTVAHNMHKKKHTGNHRLKRKWLDRVNSAIMLAHTVQETVASEWSGPPSKILLDYFASRNATSASYVDMVSDCLAGFPNPVDELLRVLILLLFLVRVYVFGPSTLQLCEDAPSIPPYMNVSRKEDDSKHECVGDVAVVVQPDNAVAAAVVNGEEIEEKENEEDRKVVKSAAVCIAMAELVKPHVSTIAVLSTSVSPALMLGDIHRAGYGSMSDYYTRNGDKHAALWCLKKCKDASVWVRQFDTLYGELRADAGGHRITISPPDNWQTEVEPFVSQYKAHIANVHLTCAIESTPWTIPCFVFSQPM
jgi:hypothetical protein